MHINKISVCISITLDTSEMFLSLHMTLSLDRAAVVWTIPGKNSGLDPPTELLDPMSTASSVWRVSVAKIITHIIVL